MPDPQTRPSSRTAAPETIHKSLIFFRIMAFVVGVGLLVLCLGMVLQYGFDKPGLSQFWDQKHGILYMIYLVATANLGFKVGWSIGKMVRVMLAGVVPFLSFWVEHKVATEVEGRLTPAL